MKIRRLHARRAAQANFAPVLPISAGLKRITVYRLRQGYTIAVLTVISVGFRPTALSLLGTILCALLSISAAAETEIHRCVQADGTVAFQETPCPDPETAPAAVDPGIDVEPDTSSADDVFGFTNPYDETPDGPLPPETGTRAPVSQSRADCEQETRDAIDAIDLELRRDSGDEQRERYLERLLELTEQLRACKPL